MLVTVSIHLFWDKPSNIQYTLLPYSQTKLYIVKFIQFKYNNFKTRWYLNKTYSTNIMINKSMIQKTIILSLFITLLSCSNSNSKIWDRYHRINSEKSKKLSESHSKYFELNDNTDTNFVITPYGIKHKKHLWFDYYNTRVALLLENNSKLRTCNRIIFS